MRKLGAALLAIAFAGVIVGGFSASATSTTDARLSKLETKVSTLQTRVHILKADEKTLRAFAVRLHDGLTVVELPLGDRLLLWTGVGEP